MAGLVPGRDCGHCTVCCYALPIDAPELKKGPGVVCKNCTGRGCAIYEIRPPTCRTFYCGWWLLPQLDDDWRPDRSGVLISPQNENIPDRFELREGIEFMILGGEDAVRRKGFVETVAYFAQARVATFLAIPGPVGHFATRVLVNDILAGAGRDRAALEGIILRILRSTQDQPFRLSDLPT